MTVTVTRTTVDEERRRLDERASRYAELINETRAHLGPLFNEDVARVSTPAVRNAINEVFDDIDLAINVTGLSLLLGELDVEDDYPGFIVDELLGRQLASTIADGEPEATLAAATFHVMDAGYHEDGAGAGIDDRTCAVAAGLQVRLSGWEWQASDGP